MPAKKTKITIDADTATTPATPAPTRTGGPVMDIVAPGNIKSADATTRPIIVSNRPVMQDPMMVAAPDTPNAPDVLPTNEPKQSPAATKLVIRPIGDVAAPAATPADSDADGVIEPSEGAVQPTDAETPKPTTDNSTPDTPGVDADVAAGTDTGTGTEAAAEADAIADADTDSAPIDAGKQADADLAASAKAMEEIDSLVADKTYFVSINSVEKRRSRHVFVAGTVLILLLAALWIDVALDAGFIQLGGLQPLTHFFTN